MADVAAVAALVARLQQGLGRETAAVLSGDDSAPLSLAANEAEGTAATAAARVAGGAKDPRRAAAMIAAAVLVPILAAPEPQLLLTARAKNLARHPGQVAFPGGRIEPSDKGPIAAALREAREEVGIEPAAVRVLGLSDRYQTGTGFDVQPVVGLLPEDTPIRISPAEVAESFVVPLSFALDPGNYLLREVVIEGRRRRFYQTTWEGRLIWGATAGMLLNLAAKL